MRKELAIIFDVFGHPNQPYLSAFYEKIKAERPIDTYAHKVITSHDNGVLPVRCNSRKEKLLHLINYFAHAKFRYKALKAYLRNPVLLNNTYQAAHFLNAQQYPPLKKVIDVYRLAFSFRGYETLVRPKVDAAWKSSLAEIYEQSQLLHFVSRHIMQEAVALGAPQDKCRVIYRSVDVEFFKPSGNVSNVNERILILSTGRLSWQKGYFFALEAMKQLLDSDYIFEYHILGDGKDHEELLFHRERLGLTNCVFFHGQQNREQVKYWLECSDIYLHPSVTEALPNAVLEAAAMELPIVATYVGGIPEAVQENKSAFLVPPADSADLACALSQLMESSDLRHQLGKAGRAFVLSNFNQNRETSDWLKFYDELLT